MGDEDHHHHQQQQQLLIQNGDHLEHFGQTLTETQGSGIWSDVILHLDNEVQLRTHRVVLASISDFLASLLGGQDNEDEVHLSLAEMDVDAVKIILDFAYDGEAKIPRACVETVCEVANELKVKFLKDSFVKVNQKEYQEIRAGRKSLKSLGSPQQQQQQQQQQPLLSPQTTSLGSPRRSSGSPTAKRVVARVSSGTSGKKTTKIKKKKLSESDTDSADSDEESLRMAAAAAAIHPSGVAGNFISCY